LVSLPLVVDNQSQQLTMSAARFWRLKAATPPVALLVVNA
jgi:hypothetical protein